MNLSDIKLKLTVYCHQVWNYLVVSNKFLEAIGKIIWTIFILLKVTLVSSGMALIWSGLVYLGIKTINLIVWFFSGKVDLIILDFSYDNRMFLFLAIFSVHFVILGINAYYKDGSILL